MKNGNYIIIFVLAIFGFAFLWNSFQSNCPNCICNCPSESNCPTQECYKLNITYGKNIYLYHDLVAQSSFNSCMPKRYADTRFELKVTADGDECLTNKILCAKVEGNIYSIKFQGVDEVKTTNDYKYCWDFVKELCDYDYRRIDFRVEMGDMEVDSKIHFELVKI